MRIALSITILAFVLAFGGLLVASVAESHRFGPLEALSVGILALFAFGAFGALRHAGDEDDA